jgi:hypothetical protein
MPNEKEDATMDKKDMTMGQKVVLKTLGKIALVVLEALLK